MINVELDMDGVLADFDKKAIELVGKSLYDFPTSQEGWDAIKHVPNIYEILDPMPDADELVSGVLKLREKYPISVGVLTAIPKVGRVPLAEQHKREWIEKRYPELQYLFKIGPHAEDKQKHCNPGDVLIDDSAHNIPQWHFQGGFGILHTNAKDSLKALKVYLELYYESEKMPSVEWLHLRHPGELIIDPDGWDRTKFEYSFHQEEVTYLEFCNRKLRSTTVIKRH